MPNRQQVVLFGKVLELWEALRGMLSITVSCLALYLLASRGVDSIQHMPVYLQSEQPCPSILNIITDCALRNCERK